MSNNFCSHIIYEDKASNVDSLYRSRDGISLAARVGNEVIFGEDPNPNRLQQRKFLDDSYAKMYLRTLADHDDGCKSVAECQCGAFARRSAGFAHSANIDVRNGGVKNLVQPASGIPIDISAMRKN